MFRTSQQRYESGGDNTGEVQSPTFQGENPRSDLNWLCLKMTLWRHFFESGDYLQGENLRSLIGRRRCGSTVPLLEAALLESMYFRSCLGGECIAVVRLE